jgi:hypothetical protein
VGRRSYWAPGLDEYLWYRQSCCSDRSKYLFWDLLHPTQATSKFADLAFYDGLAQFVSPITFKKLVEA